MNTEVPVCVHCNAVPGCTADHVPPRSFFARPRPSNLLTVPACAKCNHASSIDEVYFLAVLMLSRAGTTEVGTKLWNKGLRRTFENDLGLRRQVATSFRRRDFSTSAGVYLGRRMTLKFDRHRLEKVVAKIVRGLYFHERGFPLESGTEVLSFFLREPAHFEAMEESNHMLKPGTRQWEGTFQYRCGFVPDQPQQSTWLLWFWRTHFFWVNTSQPIAVPPIVEVG